MPGRRGSKRSVADPTQPQTPEELYSAMRKSRIRQEKRLKEVASKVGVSLSALQQFETGQTRPTLTSLRRWLRALDLPAEWADEWQIWEAARRAGDEVRERFHNEDAARSVELVVRGVLKEHRLTK